MGILDEVKLSHQSVFDKQFSSIFFSHKYCFIICYGSHHLYSLMRQWCSFYHAMHFKISSIYEHLRAFAPKWKKFWIASHDKNCITVSLMNINTVFYCFLFFIFVMFYSFILIDDYDEVLYWIFVDTFFQNAHDCSFSSVPLLQMQKAIKMVCSRQCQLNLDSTIKKFLYHMII